MATAVMDRTGYLGGSDIGAILGVDRFRTALDVYREKVGEVLPFEGNADTKRGSTLEPIAAKFYTEKTGIRLQRMNASLAHPDYPFARGHVDRVTLGLEYREIREIKCPRLGAFSKIRREGVDESKIAQLQWYLGIANTKQIIRAGEWIIFCADLWDSMEVRVDFDSTLFVEMLHRAAHFWYEHVEKKVPPTQEQADQFKIEIESVGGNVVRREDVEFVNAMSLLHEAKALKDEAEVLEGQAKERIIELIEQKPGVYLAPGMRLTYSMAQGRSSFDKKALAGVAPLDPVATQTTVMAFAKDQGVSPVAAAHLLADVAEHCRLDLSRFETRGKPYPIMRSTFYGGEE